MSIKVIRQVFNGYQGEPIDKLTLLSLAMFGNDAGGSIFPSVAKVGQMTNLSQRQARRNIRKLETQGVISVIGNQNGGKAGTTRQYQINLHTIKPNKETEDMSDPRTEDIDDRRIDDTEDMGDRGRRTSVTGDGGHGCPPISYLTVKEQLNTLSANASSVSQDSDVQLELVPVSPDEVSAKPKKSKKKSVEISDSLKAQAVEVLNHLNRVAEKNFQPVNATLSEIVGRLKEGNSVDACKAVIDYKTLHWKSDSKMSAHLSPATLFRASNFPNYLGSIPPDSISVQRTQTLFLQDDYSTYWADNSRADGDLVITDRNMLLSQFDGARSIDQTNPFGTGADNPWSRGEISYQAELESRGE